MRPTEVVLLTFFIGPRPIVINPPSIPTRSPFKQIMNIRPLLLALLLFNSSALAQANHGNEPCLPNRSSASYNALRWADNTRVSVSATRNNFSKAEIEAIKHAIDNWNDAMESINLNVRFAFAGESDASLTASDTISVNRGPTFQNQRHLAEIFPILDSSGQLTSAMITIDQGVTDIEVMTSVITHELGHSVGMEDCPKCRRGTTIMALYRGRNRGNQTVGPTLCDRVVVARGYQQPSRGRK